MDEKIGFAAHFPVAATLPVVIATLDSTELMEIDSCIDETNNTADLEASPLRDPATVPSNLPCRLFSSTLKETIKIITPLGILGLVMDKNDRGAISVRSVQPTIPLMDQVQQNDEIAAVDSLDGRRMAPPEIGHLLRSGKAKLRMRICILWYTSIVVESCNTIAKWPEAASILSSGKGSVGRDDTSRTSPSSSVAAQFKTAASVVHSLSLFASHLDIEKIFPSMA